MEDHHIFHAIEPTKIYNSGFIPGSSSTVPSVTAVILPFSVPAEDEPHSIQKHHPAPLDISYTFTWSSPEAHLKFSELNSA